MILPMALAALVVAQPVARGAEPAWNEGGTITPIESLDSNTRIDLKRPLTLDISANHTVKLRGDISTPGPFLVALTNVQHVLRLGRNIASDVFRRNAGQIHHAIVNHDTAHAVVQVISLNIAHALNPYEIAASQHAGYPKPP